MSEFTEQDEFWASTFGHDYMARNQSSDLLASNVSLFSEALRSAGKLGSLIEFGANIGLNIIALKQLFPHAHAEAVEINKSACDRLSELGLLAEVHCASVAKFDAGRAFDLVFTKGVLIHIDPAYLDDVYSRMYNHSSRYILVAEYYNPNPTSIPYRGHDDRLFKRDFAGEMMDRFPSLRLRDYGFRYHRDLSHPQDDVTWFLLEKDGFE